MIRFTVLCFHFPCEWLIQWYYTLQTQQPTFITLNSRYQPQPHKFRHTHTQKKQIHMTFTELIFGYQNDARYLRYTSYKAITLFNTTLGMSRLVAFALNHLHFCGVGRSMYFVKHRKPLILRTHARKWYTSSEYQRFARTMLFVVWWESASLCAAEIRASPKTRLRWMVHLGEQQTIAIKLIKSMRSPPPKMCAPHRPSR